MLENRRTVYVGLGLLAVAVSFLAGVQWSRWRGGVEAGQASAVAYACPMHPQYRSDRKADCPSCGMRLEPVRPDGGAGPSGGERMALPAGAVRVNPERQQTIGVKLGAVEQVSGRRTLRTTGRVVPDENAVYPIVAGADGMVRTVRGATTGSLVRRNETLLTFFAPEFVNAQIQYLSGLESLGARVPAADSAERFANSLRNLGVSEQQLEEIRTRRKADQHIQVVSPVDGIVLDRKAAVGLRATRGVEFFRIADLRRVWILADVYENQAPFIRAGSKARITSRDQNRQMEAIVSRAEPTFDEATRTLKVRLELDNPGFALKPGMFVDVRFDVDLPPSLAVPSEAIVDSGLRKTVFVDRGGGYFEPRSVETGWRLSDQVEVTKGLMAGERIVISGTFLVDSESRMKSAGQGGAAAQGAPARDPICGMDVDPARAAAAGRSSEHGGKTHYFCADECKKQFDQDPARYSQAR